MKTYKIIKTGNNPNYHTFVFDGHSSVFNHVFLDCEFNDGAAYNDVYWSDTQSLSNYRIQWTLDVQTNPGASVTIKDKNGQIASNGVAGPDGHYLVPLTQSIIRPPEWNTHGIEVEVKDKSRYQEEKLSPYSVVVELNGKEKSTTVEMDKKTMLIKSILPEG